MSDQPLEQAVCGVMRLNAMVHGAVAGLLVGLGIFSATNWLVVNVATSSGPDLTLVESLAGFR
jgi:hypothetical protein